MACRYCWFHVLVNSEMNDVVIQSHLLVQVKREILTTMIAVCIFYKTPS